MNNYLAHVVEVDADELAEAGGVVVADGLGVAVRLQDRVRLHDPVLQVGLTERKAGVKLCSGGSQRNTN